MLVPWERVFLLGDVDLLNATAHVPRHSTAHSAHQGAAKNLAKCEFVLGSPLLMTETLGNAHLPHTEERLGELMLYTRADARVHARGRGRRAARRVGRRCARALLTIESTRNLFMTAYPRMVEILQLLGSSSFMITPSEADFNGPLAAEIEQYLATDTARRRIACKLFRLAWDIAGSVVRQPPGALRALLRQRSADPRPALASIYPKDEVMERVRDS